MKLTKIESVSKRAFMASKRGRPPKRKTCAHCGTLIIGAPAIVAHQCPQLLAIFEARSRYEVSPRQSPAPSPRQSPAPSPRQSLTPKTRELNELRKEINVLRTQNRNVQPETMVAEPRDSPEPSLDFHDFQLYEKGTTKFRRLLCFQGDHFRYVHKGDFYRCLLERSTRCTVKAKVQGDVVEFRGLHVSADGQYTHQPYHNDLQDCSRYHTVQQMKLDVQGTDIPVPTMYRAKLVSLQNEGNAGLLPTLPSVHTSLHRARAKLEPRIPKDVEELIAMLTLASSEVEVAEEKDLQLKLKKYIQTGTGAPFFREVIKLDDDYAVIYCSDDGIRRLRDADRVFADGTFDVRLLTNSLYDYVCLLLGGSGQILPAI